MGGGKSSLSTRLFEMEKNNEEKLENEKNKTSIKLKTIRII